MGAVNGNAITTTHAPPITLTNSRSASKEHARLTCLPVFTTVYGTACRSDCHSYLRCKYGEQCSGRDLKITPPRASTEPFDFAVKLLIGRQWTSVVVFPAPPSSKGTVKKPLAQGQKKRHKKQLGESRHPPKHFSPMKINALLLPQVARGGAAGMESQGGRRSVESLIYLSLSGPGRPQWVFMCARVFWEMEEGGGMEFGRWGVFDVFTMGADALFLSSPLCHLQSRATPLSETQLPLLIYLSLFKDGHSVTQKRGGEEAREEEEEEEEEEGGGGSPPPLPAGCGGGGHSPNKILVFVNTVDGGRHRRARSGGPVSPPDSPTPVHQLRLVTRSDE
ncbi:unnamed protein product [Pleuronectes platessa]|uniref:Uncharacterized protein n=1 Tax=Pleuronectes platessa TaxID=8262 RepID=A0A9N7U6G0_PLEPL|nr:unnamed protein product [Pleuronectes platessa]